MVILEKKYEHYPLSRNAYYFERRQLALKVAEINEEKAKSDSRYVSLDKTRKILMLKFVKAEVNGEIEKALAYKQELEQCERERESVLKEIGLSEADIVPQVICKKCFDSGYVNRQPCDCYPGK